jgi:hypothetical protein
MLRPALVSAGRGGLISVRSVVQLHSGPSTNEPGAHNPRVPGFRLIAPGYERTRVAKATRGWQFLAITTLASETGMRLLLIAGILLAGLGGFIVVQGLHFRSEGIVHVGPISGTVHEQHTVPAWLGWAAIVGGVLLIVGGSRRKR